jgi:hypothetical protein
MGSKYACMGSKYACEPAMHTSTVNRGIFGSPYSVDRAERGERVVVATSLSTLRELSLAFRTAYSVTNRAFSEAMRATSSGWRRISFAEQ